MIYGSKGFPKLACYTFMFIYYYSDDDGSADDDHLASSWPNHFCDIIKAVINLVSSAFASTIKRLIITLSPRFIILFSTHMHKPVIAVVYSCTHEITFESIYAQTLVYALICM